VDGSERKLGNPPATATLWAEIMSRLGNWRVWVSVVLLLLVLEIAVLSIEQARWITPQPTLTLVLVLSLVITWLLTRSRLPGIVALMISLVVGSGVTAWQAYQLPAPEVRAFAAFIVFLTWLMGYISTRFIIRRQNPWVATCLGAVVILVNLSNLPGKHFLFFGFYFVTAIFLITWTRMVKKHYVTDSAAGSTRRGLPYLAALLLCLVVVAVSAAWATPEMRFPQLQTMIATRMLWKQDIEKSSFNLFAAVPAKHPSSTSTMRRDLLFDDVWNREDRINFVVSSPQPFYWRVDVYDTYTSRGWTNRPTSSNMLEEDVPWGDAGALADHNTITYTVTTGMNTDVLLTAGEFVSSDTTVLVRVSDGDVVSVTTPRVLSPGERYTVTSSISLPSPDDLSAVGADYPSSIANQYLRLPLGFPDEVRLLSENITSNASTPYEKVMAIDAYLSQFPYEENIKPPPENADGVEYFLFTRKAGFCLHYASAMVVMLRSVEVPARLAIGYLPGDPGEGDGEYILRDKHYHTWTQAYFTGYGWVDLEATPGSADSRVSIETPWISAGTVEEYRQYGALGPGEAFWFPGYPYGVPPGESATEPVRIKGPFPFADALGRVLLVLFVVVVVGLVLLIPLLIFRSAFYRWLWRVDRARLAATVYSRMCNLASMVGLRPRPQQTPREFATELAAEFPEQAEALDNIVQAYVENRFGRREGKMGLYDEAVVLKSRRGVYESLLGRLGLLRRLLSRR